MAELIKSVRLEYIEERDSIVDNKVVKNTYYYNNYKASVFRVDKNKRFVGIYINNKETKTDTQASKFIPVSFDKKWNDKTEDELIQDYLSSIKNQIKNLNINIIQNPWSDEAPPTERDYGGNSNIYYLNNGSSIQINWTSTELSGETNAHETIGVTVSYPYNLFGEIITGPNQPVVGKRWSDSGELEIPNDTPEFQNYTSFFPTTTTASVPYGSKNFDLETGIPIDEDGFFGFAANPKQVKNHVISKSIVIQEPSDIDNPSTILIMDDNTFKKSPDGNNIKRYPGGVSDLQIIKEVRDNWVKSAEPYGELDICSPNNEFCRIIPYKSPLGNNPVPEDSSPVIPNSGPSQSKVNLSVVLPEDLEIKPRTDIGTIKIYIGEPFDPFANAFNFNDDGYGSDADLLQGELEAEFGGVEDGGEQIFTSEEIEEIRKQESETNNIDDIVSPDNTPGASTGLKSTGSYTCELPKESNKNPKNWKVSYGFNGVPYYGQYDSRWNDVIYGLSNEGNFIEAKVPPKGGAKYGSQAGTGTYPVDWNGSTYKIKCDWYNGDNGFSSILGGGCGITSMSMIINYWMIKLKRGVYTSPVKMAKMACENGARSAKPPCNGTQPGSSLYKKIFDTYGLRMSSIKKSEAESLVKKGIPVMTCGTWKGAKKGDGSNRDQKGGHFIVLTGYDSEGRWRVNDPGSQGGTYYFTSPSNWPSGFWKIVPPDMV